MVNSEGEGTVKIEFGKEEKKDDTDKSAPARGLMKKSKMRIIKSKGMGAKTELKNPKKLIIPIKGVTAIFAKILYGVNVLK